MKQKNVLLVEDEMFVALDLQMTLEDDGWYVSGPFASSRDAVQYLDTNTADCAILDVRLTDGDVFPVADRLRDAGIPFVFHSGHADPTRLEQLYPGSVVCQKPCHPDALVKKLTGLIATKSSNQAA